jgi:hypothetical protein
MSVEVLFSELMKVPTATPPAPGHVAPHDGKTKLLSRDLIITSLTLRLKMAEQGCNEADASIQSIQAKKMSPTYERVELQGPDDPEKRVCRADENTETERGSLDTEYIDSLRDRPTKYLAKRLKRAGHHRYGQG